MDSVTRSEEWMQATSESLKRTSVLVIPSPGPASVVFGLLQHIIGSSSNLLPCVGHHIFISGGTNRRF